MSPYVADQSWSHEAQRLGGLERSLDPASQQHIRNIGLAKGWRCVEVGAGSGSMARWLSDQVGRAGHVLAVDIDTGLLEPLASHNLEVRRLDVCRDPLPDGQFDLVHARLVLGHVAERDVALSNMIKALRPGGVLLIEDADFIWTELGEQPICPEDASALFMRVWGPLVAFLKARGYDGHWGRKLPSAFRKHGLTQIAGEARTLIGDPNLTCAMKLTIERFADDLIAAGMATSADVQALSRVLASDGVIWTASPMVSVWGRRAADARFASSLR